MKLLFVALVASLCVAGSLGKDVQCSFHYMCTPTSWVDMFDSCVTDLKNQVKMEVGASMTYLSMGAHFARDTINRPGCSKFFFEAASEEREHAIKIIEYLLMRGELKKNIHELVPFDQTCNNTWPTVESAFQEALELEAKVTRSLHSIIATCEKPDASSKNKGKVKNDYHLVDYLSGDFLDEQYKGQRDLAGKLSTLGRMVTAQGNLGEFLFDKKLLNGEV